MHLPLTLACLGICNKEELDILETSRSGIPSGKENYTSKTPHSSSNVG